ncbi:MAG: histidinol-phosphate transaminase [Chrysothrix sp. TS-e1954]|nr:MAG: histidinol-phosphate transaminase [Chrysothrix sp. TS-e1954]
MPSKTSPFNLDACARPSILSLEPYRCARDDYQDNGTNVLLDANENAHGPGLAIKPDQLDDILRSLNRYPDNDQIELKSLFVRLRQPSPPTDSTIPPLTPANLFTGVGSDEAIINLIECFCVPGHERILVCPPTYGVYSVAAATRDVSVVTVPLDSKDFSLRPAAINAKLSEDPTIKLVFVCSPGNPTSTKIDKEAVRQVLNHPTWNGVVVVDEAYIDFAEDVQKSSMATEVTTRPNLVVTQTLSKAFGLAGIRLGVAFASEPITRLLNNLKAPYNVSSLTSAVARAALQPDSLAVMSKHRQQIIEDRAYLLQEMPQVRGVGRIRGNNDANFVLVEMLDRPNGKPCNEVALKVYERMAGQRGIVVRFRGKELGCEGCLRITVGTRHECEGFLRELGAVLEQLHATNGASNGHVDEEKKEKQANDVLA